MLFKDLRNELQNDAKLQGYNISDYGNAGGRNRNDFLQIFKDNRMPCLFNGILIELHFEIQSDRIFRLDCHWHNYEEHKNYKSKAELLKAFPKVYVP